MPKRPVTIDGDIAYVPLTSGYTAIIDAIDADLVSRFNWHVKISGNTQYARAYHNRKNISLHRMLIDAPASMLVDHKNGNGLDNRRSNLRLATSTQNNYNRVVQKNNKCGLKGVYFHNSRNRRVAKIRINKKMVSIGYFSNKYDAHEAYQARAKEIHGEFWRPE